MDVLQGSEVYEFTTPLDGDTMIWILTKHLDETEEKVNR